jgi:hypothetical protein
MVFVGKAGANLKEVSFRGNKIKVINMQKLKLFQQEMRKTLRIKT